MLQISQWYLTLAKSGERPYTIGNDYLDLSTFNNNLLACKNQKLIINHIIYMDNVYIIIVPFFIK